MRILSKDSATISFDHGEVHSLSVDFLKLLHEQNVSVGMGALASALTLGRLMSEKKLESDEEIKFMSATLDWAGAYFAGGGSN